MWEKHDRVFIYGFYYTLNSMFIKVDPKRFKLDTEEIGRTSKIRSFLKALTWRTIATSDTFIISLFITGTIEWAASIATLEIFTKTGLYYLHERGWDRIRIGQDENDSS